MGCHRGSLDKLNILLLTYIDSHGKVVQENPLKQILKMLVDYNGELEVQVGGWVMEDVSVQKIS